MSSEKEIVKMSKNPNEYQRNQQYGLIKPYFDMIKSYDPEQNGSIVEYSMSVIARALAARSEYEKIPEYVRQIDKYVVGTEIMIVATVFKVIVQTVPKEYWSPEDMRELYRRCVEYGRNRRWPTLVLQNRVMTELGIPFLLDDPSIEDKMKDSDYN